MTNFVVCILNEIICNWTFSNSGTEVNIFNVNNVVNKVE